jgi:enoyl-[acyl-carrier protein] reductase I
MDLTGKTILVLGVANEQSIAWHAAKVAKSHGARVFVSYQQKYRSRFRQLLDAKEMVPDGYGVCDVTKPEEIQRLLDGFEGQLDGVVHSVAFVPPAAMGKTLTQIEPEDFVQTIDASAFSLVRVVRHLAHRLAPSVSVVALSFLGAQRVFPGYGAMGVAKATLESVVRELAAELGPRGVRVNAVSPGPIRTLAAQAIPNFDALVDRFANLAPLRAAVDAADVGELIAFLLSERASRMTGQVLNLDAGYSIAATF